MVLQVSELVEKETKNAVLCYEVHYISLRIVFVLLRHLAEKKKCSSTPTGQCFLTRVSLPVSNTWVQSVKVDVHNSSVKCH